MANTDKSGVSDSVEVRVKGPDREAWAWRDKLIKENPELAGVDYEPLAIGEIRHESTEHEIKGPGPAWERDEEGRFVNRD